jgi:hypothetical protein
MKFARILAGLVAVAFLLLLVVGFDNMLSLLRSRVALFLALIPFVALFFWSVYKAIPRRKNRRDDVIDITPPKN